jgi:hypothetical protein
MIPMRRELVDPDNHIDSDDFMDKIGPARGILVALGIMAAVTMIAAGVWGMM